MRVALFFMYPSFGGGSTSYTVHLFEGMRRAGLEPTIYRVRARGEARARPFAKYDGVTYHNISVAEALEITRTRPSLMTAPAHSKDLKFCPDVIEQLMRAGMRITVHDPNEFKVYDHLQSGARLSRPPFCIRPTMRNFFEDAIYVPHPYVREFSATSPKHRDRELHAVSVARVSFVKRTEIILDANRLLPKDRRVELRGGENRLYTKFKILPNYPEFTQGQTGFPMTWGASARECARARYAVDMTWFPDDGGGSQYSFMEAWDAGAVCVLHSDWLRYKGEMHHNENCIAVGGPEDLARLLGGDRRHDSVVRQGYADLRRHDPAEVAREYWTELNR